MKVLIATKKMQGVRSNDFFWCEEGELVTFSMECDGEKVDGKCGCRRAMAGMESHKATTTMEVVERDIDLFQECRKSLISAGWCKEGDDNLDAWAKQNADELSRIADFFPAGTVIEKRGNKFQPRRLKRKAG